MLTHIEQLFQTENPSLQNTLTWLSHDPMKRFHNPRNPNKLLKFAENIIKQSSNLNLNEHHLETHCQPYSWQQDNPLVHSLSYYNGKNWYLVHNDNTKGYKIPKQATETRESLKLT